MCIYIFHETDLFDPDMGKKQLLQLQICLDLVEMATKWWLHKSQERQNKSLSLGDDG